MIFEQILYNDGGDVIDHMEITIISELHSRQVYVLFVSVEFKQGAYYRVLGRCVDDTVLFKPLIVLLQEQFDQFGQRCVQDAIPLGHFEVFVEHGVNIKLFEVDIGSQIQVPIVIILFAVEVQ